jgi:hypothetical protein
MQVKLKMCAGCEKEKHIWKQHEGKRYCQSCWNRIKPTSPNSHGNSTLSRQTTPIPKQSPRRVKEEAIYKPMRLVFLRQHPVCKMNITGMCTVKATDIQHTKGRGKYFLDLTTWIPACRTCHSYADTHPEEAIENGWAQLRLTNDNTENNT